MKKVILTLMIALFSFSIYAQNVLLHLDNLPAEGLLLIGVCINNEQFENASFEATQQYLLDGSYSEKDVYFDLPEGEYGICIMVDVNSNYKFDYGLEYYGFSNGFVPMGPPSYDDFKFNLGKKGHEETIALRK